MPYRSDAQRRFFHAAAKRGEISPKTVEHWDEASRGKEVPERVSANKTDIAGPDLYMSEDKKRKKFYEDIISNPENYATKQPIVKFDSQGQWKIEKYEPSGLALDNRGADRYSIGDREPRPLNQANADNKLKTHGMNIAGGFNSEVVKCDKNGQWKIEKSNYGPKGGGQYTQADNVKRKMGNVGESAVGGPNKNVKRYTTASPAGSTKDQINREAAAAKKINRKKQVISLKEHGHLAPEHVHAQGPDAVMNYLRSIPNLPKLKPAKKP